jgi:hypothetical protein
VGVVTIEQAQGRFVCLKGPSAPKGLPERFPSKWPVRVILHGIQLIK